MQSDGGLASVDGFSGHKAILSGPAGGYVGYALTTRWRDAGRPVTGAGDAGGASSEGPVCSHSGDNGMQVIGFDMGGTSTDVSRYAGAYEHVFETTTAGVTIQVRD
jgi:5-oxoprolinase (ATP-hydrolysing)